MAATEIDNCRYEGRFWFVSCVFNDNQCRKIVIPFETLRVWLLFQNSFPMVSFDSLIIKNFIFDAQSFNYERKLSKFDRGRLF